MAEVQDQFKINLNQNLWGLVVGMLGLGAAERYQLQSLFWVSIVIAGIMVISIAVTTLAYTIHYWKRRN